mgnify:CR=1 FL=1
MQFQDDLVKLQKMADTDYLTGLMNRRAFLAVADDASAELGQRAVLGAAEELARDAALVRHGHVLQRRR